MKRIILILTFIALSVAAYAQDDKTVTLVASGQGKTQDEAKQSALRYAIEQAFGTFISSNTEILNDELVKDEIVSVTNGNIQKFEVISEVQIPDGGYATTLKATVSVTKLTSFAESKGFEVEFKGSLFGANIRQQKLNEDSEYKAISNLVNVCQEILANSLDYSVEVSDPVTHGADYSMVYTVTIEPNNNYDSFLEYFRKTMASIAMSDNEIESYRDLQKPTFAFTFTTPTPLEGYSCYYRYNDARAGYTYYYRNKLTRYALQSFFLSSNKHIVNFNIYTDIDTITIKAGAEIWDRLIPQDQNVYVHSEGYRKHHHGLFGNTVQENLWVRLNKPECPVNEIMYGRCVGQGYPNFWPNNYEESSWCRYVNSFIYLDGFYYYTYDDINREYELDDLGMQFSTWMSSEVGKELTNKIVIAKIQDYKPFPGPPYGQEIFPNGSSRFETIGTLFLEKPIYKHEYSAVYTLDEIMKITKISIEKY